MNTENNQICCVFMEWILFGHKTVLWITVMRSGSNFGTTFRGGALVFSHRGLQLLIC